MTDVPRGAPRGKKDKEVFNNIDVDYADITSLDFGGLEVTGSATETVIDANGDVVIMLPGNAATDLFTVEDQASHALLKVDGTGIVTPYKGMALPFKHHTGVALADLTAAIGDPAALPDGFTAIYENDTDGKTYLIMVALGVFWSEELTAITA